MLQKFSFLAWSIWKERNAVVFDKQFFNPVRCLIRTKKTYAEWRIQTCMSDNHSQRGAFSSSSKNFHLVRWHPPPPGFIKINFDESLINSRAVGGYILRDWIGKVIKTGAANYGSRQFLLPKQEHSEMESKWSLRLASTDFALKAIT